MLTIHRKIPLALIMCLVLLLTMVLYSLSFGWMATDRSLGTVTKVERPSLLRIMGPNRSELDLIRISDIDLSTPVGSSHFVFCVYGRARANQSYHLEVAYTTNIPFEYSLYKASIDTPTAECSTLYQGQLLENTYYYQAIPIGMEKLNASGSNAILSADNPFYQATYADTDITSVQTNAMPMYSLARGLARRAEPDVDGFFADYYVLEVSWAHLTRNKETDIIYLLVVDA